LNGERNFGGNKSAKPEWFQKEPGYNAANGSPYNRTDQKNRRQHDGCISQFLVKNAAHDGFSKNMKQVGSDHQYSLHSGTHESRSDNKSAAGADTPGDQPGTQADQDGTGKYKGYEKSSFNFSFRFSGNCYGDFSFAD
jgi:hypothetical protein